MEIRPYRESDADAVIALWHEVFPITLPHHDPATSIRRKLAVDRELFLVAEIDGAVAGTAMGGYDGHRGWVYSVAVRPDLQRGGIGRALMTELERRLRALDCPKINLQIEGENAQVVAFYEQLGFAVEERVSMGKRL
jgi:ribosomal protein S18 acetylase RimI-like enzyme